MKRSAAKAHATIIREAAPGRAFALLPTRAIVDLDDMALTALGIDTLETRNMDSLDFHDVSASTIRDLIARAYALGLRDGGES